MEEPRCAVGSGNGACTRRLASSGLQMARTNERGSSRTARASRETTGLRSTAALAVAIDDLVGRQEAAIQLAARRTCARWHVHGADADDLRSEILLCLLQNHGRVLRRFEGRSALGTYLFQVANRVAYRWIRQRARRRHFEVLAGDTYACDRDLGEVETETRSSDSQQELREALSSLPDNERFMLKCRARGMTVRQIAETLGCSVKAAEHRLSRTVIHLRAALARPAPVAEPHGIHNVGADLPNQGEPATNVTLIV